MKYLIALLVLASSITAAPKCKNCAKMVSQKAILERQIVALLKPVPYKLNLFEDARVRIRVYPDGNIEYELKPNKIDVSVVTVKNKKRFRKDTEKTFVIVLENGEEVKANINIIKGK